MRQKLREFMFLLSVNRWCSFHPSRFIWDLSFKGFFGKPKVVLVCCCSKEAFIFQRHKQWDHRKQWHLLEQRVWHCVQMEAGWKGGKWGKDIFDTGNLLSSAGGRWTDFHPRCERWRSDRIHHFPQICLTCLRLQNVRSVAMCQISAIWCESITVCGLFFAFEGWKENLKEEKNKRVRLICISIIGNVSANSIIYSMIMQRLRVGSGGILEICNICLLSDNWKYLDGLSHIKEALGRISSAREERRIPSISIYLRHRDWKGER